LLFTWQLTLDPAATLCYNSHQDHVELQGYQDHWAQAVLPLPLQSVGPVALVGELHDTTYTLQLASQHTPNADLKAELELVLLYEGLEGLVSRNTAAATLEHLRQQYKAAPTDLVLDVSDSGWIIRQLASTDEFQALHFASFAPWRQHLTDHDIDDKVASTPRFQPC
jgi:hypothetical protein